MKAMSTPNSVDTRKSVERNFAGFFSQLISILDVCLCVMCVDYRQSTSLVLSEKVRCLSIFCLIWSFLSVAELCKSYKADIVFVIDSSGCIRDQNPKDGSYDNWHLLLRFVNEMVNVLNIGSSQVRVGAVKLSTSAESVFHLN